MNIALVGYGKMGKAIEVIALQKGHNIVLKIDDQNIEEFTMENLQKADVAIEFTMPQSAVKNILQCITAGVPVVCGTTGWLEQKNLVEEKCKESNGSFLTTTNFSIGVNIFFELNRKLASLMQPFENYNIEIEEVHHTQKKDAPSGTAITLAEGVIEKSSVKKNWLNEPTENTEALSIISKRIDAVPGTHTVKYTSAVDDIEIIHTAHNRKGFAAGALMAAEYIHNKRGIFTMKEVLNF